MDYELDGIARHPADQTRAWNLETSDNLLGSFVQEGVEKFNNPKQFQRNENSILVKRGLPASSWILTDHRDLTDQQVQGRRPLYKHEGTALHRSDV